LHVEEVGAAAAGGEGGPAGPDPSPVPGVLDRDDPTPVVLAHGFTQTGRLWGGLARALAVRRRVLAVDLPGHAGSTAVRADLESAGRLLLDAAGPDGPVDLVGYSLGARIALHGALADPGRCRRLVLIGGTAGIEDDEARARRRAADEALADSLEASGDVEEFVRRWLAAPMFAGLRTSAADRAERLRNTAAGLASSLRLNGVGTQRPRWGDLGALDVPVLAVAGADDARFVASGRRLAAGSARGTLALVPGAGHAAHLQQPQLAARIVGAWLESTGRA
jgi:2-succinyl-6-hydroxy-2,4-cyclohexadiene-1-carboxylate synthase